jgi:hypothetical protein
MGLLVRTEGIYCGSKTGNKKNSIEQWVQLQFKAHESYKGVTINSESISRPNLSLFPDDNFDFSSLQVGQKYGLDLDVSARVTNGKAYPEYRVHKIHAAKQQ